MTRVVLKQRKPNLGMLYLLDIWICLMRERDMLMRERGMGLDQNDINNSK